MYTSPASRQPVASVGFAKRKRLICRISPPKENMCVAANCCPVKRQKNRRGNLVQKIAGKIGATNRKISKFGKIGVDRYRAPRAVSQFKVQIG